MKQNCILYLILPFLIIIGVSLKVTAQYSCSQWEIIEIPFISKSASVSPLDESFGAIFESGTGEIMNVPGFYNDNKTWIIRFCPPKEGLWTLRTYSSIQGLSGKTMEINVKSNSDPDMHGPVKISSKDPSKFVYTDNTPYFLLAFECDWLFALDAKNPEAIPNTKKMVSHVKANGFNQVVMNVYAYDAKWGERDKIPEKYNFAKPDVYPFGGDNTNPDHSTLNIGFYKHLDRLVSHLNEEGIVAHLMIYVWNKNVNWPDPDSRDDNRYFDYVVKRYQAFPNLIWNISKEALLYGRVDEEYISGRIDRLRNLDGHGRLVSVHDYDYCDSNPEKVDFISVQQWRSYLYDNMLSIKEKFSDKPLLNIEHGGYETSMHEIFDRAAYTDPVVCLDRNYQCAFAGTYSTYYWQNTSWYEVNYEPFLLPPHNQPRFDYYKHMSGFFSIYDFNKLSPGKGHSNPPFLTDHENTWIFLVNSGRDAITGKINGITGKKYSVKWFNPLTGELFESGVRDLTKGNWVYEPVHPKIDSPFSLAVFEAIE